MDKHFISIDRYKGSLEDLVEDICNLRYDVLSFLLCRMQIRLDLDTLKDNRKGRYKLASKLEEASINISKTRDNILDAWEISKPYMNIEDA